MTISTYHCPKCSRQLQVSGVATIDDVDYPIFQCDDCLHKVKAFGDEFEVNLTFAVRPDGSWFDPTKDDEQV
jgi:DNA-directed RNA polymerase subunit RPC12/RpoP